jgi:hypothetical protein
MDALQDHFSCVLGENKAPLACVIPDVAGVPPEADDLATTGFAWLSGRSSHFSTEVAGSTLAVVAGNQVTLTHSLDRITRFYALYGDI